MAGAFQSGFRMGQSAYQQALDNKDREARRAQEAEAHRLAMRTGGLQADALEAAAAQRRSLEGMRTEMADYQQGFNRQGFNTAADAEFDAALAASDNAVRAENVARKGGMPAPVAAYAPPTQGNLAAEQGMRTQFTQAPDITSDGFQRGMSGLQQRYALAAGDMKGFGDLQAAERQRRTNAEDAAWAVSVQNNPTGPEAVAARSYVNDKSRKLSTKVDPKTNITSFVMTDGDSYKEIKVSPSDLGKIAIGVRRLQRGDPSGLDLIASVNKDIAAAARDDLKIDLDVGKANNEANYKLGSLNNQTEGLKIQREGVGLQRERLNAERNQILGPALNYSLGANGELVPTMTGLKFNTRTGAYEGVSVPLTGQRGIIPSSAFDPQKTAKLVESLVGQPTGRNGRDGKPILHTPETAQAAVTQQIIRAHTNQNPAANLNADGVKAAQAAAAGGGGGGLKVDLPLRSPTMDQYYAMSPEALQVRAAAGDQVAKGLLARTALGTPEPAAMGMDRGY